MVKVNTAFTVLVMVSLLCIAACTNDDGGSHMVASRFGTGLSRGAQAERSPAPLG